MTKAIFIDRDGTIGGSNTIVYPGEFQLFPFVEESITKLKNREISSYLSQINRVFQEEKRQEKILKKNSGDLVLIKYIFVLINMMRVAYAGSH